jgi:signal transduction histidine kinase
MMDRFWSFSWLNVSLKFLVVTSTAIAIVFTGFFFWLWKNQEDQIMEQVRKQATILYQQIVLTREWVAAQDSLLRKIGPGVTSDHSLGQTDVQLPDGSVLTKISPSILTTELSKRAVQNGLYYFKLTGLNFLNPKNAPDDLEKTAIQTFRETSEKEMFRLDFQGSKPILRYIAPVYVTENCLNCHSDQGYKAGEVGGCLSIFVPMDEARQAIQRSGAALFAGTLGFGGILIGLLFVSTRSLLFRRIRDIKSSINRINLDNASPTLVTTGDELKEISDFCYLIDEKLKEQHELLEKRIMGATKDLHQTKENLEKANKELEQLNRANSDFFSDISHELRTPLTNIKGAVDILERISSDNSKYIEIIKRNSEHLVKLVVDLLDYSKLEAGHLELKRERTPLAQLVCDAIVAEDAEAQKKCVKVSTSLEELILNVDRDRIYQVITNLLSNAIRFAPQNSLIIVEGTALNQNQAVISVQDEGPGIDENYQEAIFRKFYQAPLPKESGFKKGSSGIGLAICRGLIEAHNGKIWVESKTGSGSKFIFTVSRWLDDDSKTNFDC